MYGHLVTVEVGVERSTCKRMKLDCLALNHLRLECLNTQTVKCRRTVQKNRVTLHYMLQNIPNDWLATVNNLLCRLYSLNDTALYELANDKWLVKFGCHKLGKTAIGADELFAGDVSGDGLITDADIAAIKDSVLRITPLGW